MRHPMDGNLAALDAYMAEYDSYDCNSHICDKCGEEFAGYPDDDTDGEGYHLACGGYIVEIE